MSNHIVKRPEIATARQFMPIQSRDEYALYFNQLCEVFEVFLHVFKKEKKTNDIEHYEREVVVHFLSRFLFTIEALRIKCTYDESANLKVDLSDSGFPSYYDIDGQNTDLNVKSNRMDLPRTQYLKQELLDHLMRRHSAPQDLLQQLGQRVYLDRIDPAKLFLTFSDGLLQRCPDAPTHRRYLFSWACYDFKTNRPYIVILLFEQDLDDAPLEKKEENYQRFKDVIQAEGSRAPDLAVVAVGIDQSLRHIHPKVVKRICIGPFCSSYFSRTPADLVELLDRYAERDSDAILLFEDEILISKEQTVSKSFFSTGQVREVFSIPENDLECYQRKASVIHKYMLLPHTVAQHLDFRNNCSAYSDYKLITHDASGGLYAG